MPNMDDIAFFESIAYERRGGIWSDASRRQRSDPQTSVSTEGSGDTQSVSTVSAPDLIHSKTLISGTLPDMSQSVEELPVGNAVDVKAELSVPSLSEVNSKPSRTRRRSWFSTNGGGMEPTMSSGSNPDSSNVREIEENRGREGQDDRIHVAQSKESTSRSSSQSRSVNSLLPDEIQASLVKAHLSTHSASRSTSQHSTKREPEPEADLTLATRSESTPSTPRRRSDASQTTRPASPPSFFSTLKSRAADKQALQNTAKEAMRKWGVNWGGLKKDTSNAGSSGDEPVDTGPTLPHLQPERSPNQAHKSKASYAEVRAAVAERKERERNGDALELSRSISPSSSPDNPTTNPLALLPNGSIHSDNPVNPSVVASTSRLSTSGLSAKKSLPSISRVSTDMDAQRLVDQEEAVPAPIHVQPQAKTMTIPGIHVSHRGDLQSMGYVAPQLPVTSSESKSKNPTMQSMYRLWKSPVLSGQEVDTQEQLSQPLEQTGDSTQDKDVTPLALPPILSVSPQSVRPTPPPLPPRSTPTRPAVNKASTSLDQSPASPATEALKIIVSKDDARGQASLDQPPPESSASSINKGQPNELGLDTALYPQENLAVPATSTKVPPPLPPRRVQI
jgi:hypothetical protein